MTSSMLELHSPEAPPLAVSRSTARYAPFAPTMLITPPEPEPVAFCRVQIRGVDDPRRVADLLTLAFDLADGIEDTGAYRVGVKPQRDASGRITGLVFGARRTPRTAPVLRPALVDVEDCCDELPDYDRLQQQAVA